MVNVVLVLYADVDLRVSCVCDVAIAKCLQFLTHVYWHSRSPKFCLKCVSYARKYTKTELYIYHITFFFFLLLLAESQMVSTTCSMYCPTSSA